MPDIQYERVTISHLELLIDYRINFLLELKGEQTEESIDQLRINLAAYFADAIPNEKYICWWAKDNDKVVGIGGMAIRRNPGNFRNPSGCVGYIMNMYTVPAYRKMGISSTILDKLVTTGKELGINFFELHATKMGEPVYIKYGFLQHPEPTYNKRYE